MFIKSSGELYKDVFQCAYEQVTSAVESLQGLQRIMELPHSSVEGCAIEEKLIEAEFALASARSSMEA